MSTRKPKKLCGATDDGAVCWKRSGHVGLHEDNGYIWATASSGKPWPHADVQWAIKAAVAELRLELEKARARENELRGGLIAAIAVLVGAHDEGMLDYDLDEFNANVDPLREALKRGSQ